MRPLCVSFSTQELFGVILSNIYSRTFSKSFGESWEGLGQQGWKAAVPNYKVPNYYCPWLDAEIRDCLKGNVWHSCWYVLRIQC